MVDGKIMVGKNMVKKKKVVPFHVTHNYEKFIHNGVTFWARDKEDADKYVKKISS